MWKRLAVGSLVVGAVMGAVVLSFQAYVAAQTEPATELKGPIRQQSQREKNERAAAQRAAAEKLQAERLSAETEEKSQRSTSDHVRQKWEYHTQTIPEGEVDPVGVLNKLGEKGWEMVAVVPSVKGAVTIYWKRPK